MKNIRMILWVALGLALLLNYSAWVSDFAPRDAAAAAEAQAKAEADKRTNPLGAAIPVAAPPAAAAPAGAVPPAAVAPATGDVPAPLATATAPAAAAPSAAVLNVRTDVLDVDVSLRGGELARADLLNYPQVKGEATPVRLLQSGGTGQQYLVQTGLAGNVAGATPESYPTHLAQFTSDFTGFEMQSGQDELRVPLEWTSPDGVKVTKTLVFRRGSYRIDLEYKIENGSAATWSVRPYVQILHDMPPVERSYFNVDSYSFTGPALWEGKYEKLDVSKAEDAALDREITNGWLASLQHHFVAAVVPAKDEAARYSLNVRGNEYLARTVSPPVDVIAGAAATVKETLFVGPKLQRQLSAIHPELGRAADFGVLTFLSKPLFWLLDKAHGIFSNWGLAIIAVTFLLKLAFYPLSEASGRSMAKMKLVAPRMKAIQEQYKDDRQKLGQAMMELYKKEKVNPASGCLPQLIQIPVFIAFYWVLVESVEMRQAPFFGWLQDLSARDPFYILPLIMAGAMFLQYKLQPTPPDPVQAKVFMILPLVMSATFAFFPSGLVLYYTVNTVLTIAQQWNINRRLEASASGRN
ncbi:MAG: membrane protein insertase YidC [Proteobacteria bacterium]|nr:membrane protein insertase YidC [Pseudomonadota bacterium]